MHRLYLVAPGPRPFFGDLARHLWGRDCDFDSDGNDDRPPPGGWTELTVALRPDGTQRVDVDPLDGEQPLVLVVRSEQAALAQAAASFLQAQTGAELRHASPPGRG